MPYSLSVYFYSGVLISLEYFAWGAINRGSQIPYDTGIRRCSSALTHQVPRISLSDPAPLNILHSTKVKPRTPKYKEASYIAEPPEGHTHQPWKIDRDDRRDARRRPAWSYCSIGTGRRLANWSELPKTPPPSSLPPNRLYM